MHHGFEKIEHGQLGSGPFAAVDTPPNQLRWSPLPPRQMTGQPISSMASSPSAGNGDPAAQAGIVIHLYVANRSVDDHFFYNADGELLIVPQQRRLLARTAMGLLDIKTGEILVIPRGVRFRIELPNGYDARLHLRKLRRGFPVTGAGADWCQRPGQCPRFPGAGRGL